MNVNAVNILGNAGKTGQGAAGVIKFIPSREETNERLMKEAKAANGGISKDGDTVNVSAGNTKLNTMYETKPQGNVSFLKDNDTEGKSVAETISGVAADKGISTELYNIDLDRAEAKMLSDEVGAIKKADSDLNKNADLSQYNAYELREMYQDGDISSTQYSSEIKSREQSKAAANEKEDFQIPREDNTSAAKEARKGRDDASAAEEARKARDNASAAEEGRKARDKDPVAEQAKKAGDRNSSVRSTEERNAAYLKAEENDPFKKLADKYDPFARKNDEYDPLEKKIEERERAITEKEQREIYNVAEKMEKDPYDVVENMQKDPYDVALEMQGDPYDVAGEMAEGTAEANAAGEAPEYGAPDNEENAVRAEENGNAEETITVNVSAPETPEQQPELENITINVSAAYAAADNSENIAAARSDSAQAAIDENVMNSRVVVQEA